MSLFSAQSFRANLSKYFMNWLKIAILQFFPVKTFHPFLSICRQTDDLSSDFSECDSFDLESGLQEQVFWVYIKSMF